MTPQHTQRYVPHAVYLLAERLKREGVALAMASLPHVREHWFVADHDLHAQHPVELADVMLDQVAAGFLG